MFTDNYANQEDHDNNKRDVVDTETTEDMMYPDCSSHFITEDMEAEYNNI